MPPILIIDPGHGGEDPGGGSNKYWHEKQLALKISLYQFKRFKELGISVALTRDEDITLPPSKRARQVKWSRAKYCLSNHINAGGGRGAECIHSIYSNDSLSKNICNALKQQGQVIRRIFTRSLPENNEKDYYYMHRETGAVEAVIVEYGFADNEIDTNILKERWQDLAEAVVKGFCTHINHPYTASKLQNPSPWAATSWEWVIKNNLLDGSRPKENTTREELAVVLQRFYQMIKK